MRSLLTLAASLLAIGTPTQARAKLAKPTIVLVHGAFADSSSWNGVIEILQRDGYPVVAAANPLRGVRVDADALTGTLKSIVGPVVLVGHSYGGSVISEAGFGQPNVKALVYVAAFAPDAGESALALSGKFPGSTLGGAIAPPVKLTNGDVDLSISQQRFPAQFAGDVPVAKAKVMAAAQRPVANAALTEASTAPAWAQVPCWFIYGDKDLNIPPAALAFMAERAHSRQTVVVRGASHVVMISHAPEVAALIERAAAGN